MGVYTFPGQSGWSQRNINDTDGSLFATKNIDLSTGKLQLAPRMTAFTTSASLSNLGLLKEATFATGGPAINDGFTFVTSAGVFYSTSGNLSSILENTASGVPVPTAYSGNTITFVGEIPHVAAGNTIKYYNGAWSSNLVSLQSAYPHPMCISPGDKVLVGDLYKVHSITSSDAVTSFTSTFPVNFVIKDILADNIRVYVFSYHAQQARSARMFIWDGTSSAFTSSYDIESLSIQSACISNGDIYVLDIAGNLKKFNGLGFDIVAYLPYAKVTNRIRMVDFYDVSGGKTDNTIASSKDGVYINLTTPLNDFSSSTVTSLYTNQNAPLGVYEYIPGVGVYHKYSPNFTTDFNSPTDFGNYDSTQTEVGGIYVLPPASDSTTNGPNVKFNSKGSDVIIGGRIRTDSSTQRYVLCSATAGRNIGYFVTSKIFPQSKDEVFLRVVIKYNNCFDSNTLLKLKYKVNTKQNLPVTLNQGTWTGTTTFTTTDPRCGSVTTGDEVCITSGPGAGKSTQIASITNNAGTYTITTDDAVRPSASYPVTGTVVDNFKLLDTLTGATTNDGIWTVEIPTKNIGGFLQLKLEMDSSEQVVIESMTVVTRENRPM